MKSNKILGALNRPAFGVFARRFSGFVPACLSVFSSVVMAVPMTFTDAFNRPDGLIGNGWIDASGNVLGNLVIRNGVLTTPTAGGFAGIYRSIDYSSPVTISATLTQQNGYGGLTNRYESGFLLGTAGSLSSGYQILFSRSDSLANNSTVSLWANGSVVSSTSTLLSRQYSPFQFGTSIIPTVTYTPSDGRIYGSIVSDGNTFNFDFGTRPDLTTMSTSNIGLNLEFPDGRLGPIIHPSFDNVTISYGAAVAPSLSLVTRQAISPSPPPKPTTLPQNTNLPSDGLAWFFGALNDPTGASGAAAALAVDAANEQYIRQKIQDLQTPSVGCGVFPDSFCKPWSSSTKTFINGVADGFALAGILNSVSSVVGGPSGLGNQYDLASKVGTVVSLQPTDNQRLIWANRAVTLLDQTVVTSVTGSVSVPLSSQVVAVAGTGAAVTIGALFGANLVIWTDIIPNQLRSLTKQDPPTIEYSVPLSISLPVMPSITGSGFPVLDKFLTDFSNATLRTAFYLDAVVATNDRYGAAYRAGDIASAIQQLSTLLDYLRLSQGALNESATLFKQLPSMLDLAGLSSLPLDLAAYQDLQAYISLNGINDMLMQLLLADGLMSEQISQLYDEMVKVELDQFQNDQSLYDVAMQFSALVDRTFASDPLSSSIPEPPSMALLLVALAFLIQQAAVPRVKGIASNADFASKE